jgi:hypothetical protein
MKDAIVLGLWFVFWGSLLFGYVKTAERKERAKDRAWSAECAHGMHGACTYEDCDCRCHRESRIEGMDAL